MYIFSPPGRKSIPPSVIRPICGATCNKIFIDRIHSFLLVHASQLAFSSFFFCKSSSKKHNPSDQTDSRNQYTSIPRHEVRRLDGSLRCCVVEQPRSCILKSTQTDTNRIVAYTTLCSRVTCPASSKQWHEHNHSDRVAHGRAELGPEHRIYQYWLSTDRSPHARLYHRSGRDCTACSRLYYCRLATHRGSSPWMDY